MIILITGASHTGKTLLAQKMLVKYFSLMNAKENRPSDCPTTGWKT